MDKVAVWCDGTWCEEEDLEEFLSPPCAKSDDYDLLEVPEDVDDIEIWVADQCADQLRLVITKDAKLAFVKNKHVLD